MSGSQIVLEFPLRPLVRVGAASTLQELCSAIAALAIEHWSDPCFDVKTFRLQGSRCKEQVPKLKVVNPPSSYSRVRDSVLRQLQ